MGKVQLDGKQFALDGERFAFRGVTYGTFRPRDDGARFPEREQVKRDFSAMRDAGFTVVRTYTAPPDDVVDVAADWGLHVLAGVYYSDWRYLLGASRHDRKRVAADARAEVRGTARRLAGHDNVLAGGPGHEVPAARGRWGGASGIRPRV